VRAPDPEVADAGSASSARILVGAPTPAHLVEAGGSLGGSEVEEAARGHGLRRAVGELLIWPLLPQDVISVASRAGLVVCPRATRWVASLFTVLTGADSLQIAKAEDLLSLIQ
jgi:uncharacterized protein DUF1360